MLLFCKSQTTQSTNVCEKCAYLRRNEPLQGSLSNFWNRNGTKSFRHVKSLGHTGRLQNSELTLQHRNHEIRGYFACVHNAATRTALQCLSRSSTTLTKHVADVSFDNVTTVLLQHKSGNQRLHISFKTTNCDAAAAHNQQTEK